MALAGSEGTVGSRQKLAVLAVVILGVVGLVVGSVQRHGPLPSSSMKVRIIEPSGAPASGSDPLPVLDGTGLDEAYAGTVDGAGDSGQVVVHVVGRVKSPGLYHLPPGARVADAVEAAGGAASDADTEAVNLAARAVDGEQIYLPRKGETVVPPAHETSSPSSSSSSGSRVSASTSGSSSSASARPSAPLRVNINTAGSAELDRLPGVGPSTAAKIIDYRKAAGGFARPEDLMNVPGIGEKKFADMKPYVVVR